MTRGLRNERGAVTAETVMVLPMLLAVTAGMMWLLAVGGGQLRMIDAARETARALARGDDRASAIALGARIAPEGARIAVTRSGDRFTVAAVGAVRGPGSLFDFVPAVQLRAESVALVEEVPDSTVAPALDELPGVELAPPMGHAP